MGLLANSGFVDVAVENLTDSQGHKIVEENGQRRMIIARGVRRW